jgi:hypothetical protein
MSGHGCWDLERIRNCFFEIKSMFTNLFLILFSTLTFHSPLNPQPIKHAVVGSRMGVMVDCWAGIGFTFMLPKLKTGLV